MFQPRRVSLRAALWVVVVASLAATAAPALASNPRLDRSEFTYRGSFLMPRPLSDEKTFAYGGTALAYDPARDSLFAVGHDWYQLSAETTTPRPLEGAKPTDLNRARYLQPFVDATDGLIDATGQDDNKIGGQLVYRHRLCGSVHVYYDAAGEQTLSHWARPSTSLTAGRARGLFDLGGRLGAGFVSGYMALVPRKWRDRLGGPALTGNCCIRSSAAPRSAPRPSPSTPASWAS
jgi:hypothetical protein